MRISSLPADPHRLPKSLPCNALLLLNPHRQSSSEANGQLTACLRQFERNLPALSGKPVTLEMLPELSVCGGKLLSKCGRGTAVYAGSFIRERRIVLETSLLLKPQLFCAILVHELFHFVWVRLGTPARNSFTALLTHERDGHARGELGESSGVAKERSLLGIRRWKHYVCESFCDTAGYLLTGSLVGPCVRLSNRRITARKEWFALASADVWKF